MIVNDGYDELESCLVSFSLLPFLSSLCPPNYSNANLAAVFERRQGDLQSVPPLSAQSMQYTSET
jgi:hypothetical protein